MRPSVKSCMAALQIEGAKAELLRFETRAFLMEQNKNSNSIIARLDSEKLRELAVCFLELHGPRHFPSSELPRPVWGLNNEQIIRQVTKVMECQKKSKTKKLETTKAVEREVFMSESDSASDSEPSMRRLATPDLAYHPGGIRSNGPLRKQYRTRNNAQPGMPPMLSIESNEMCCTGTGRSRKRRRTTMSGPGRESRTAGSFVNGATITPTYQSFPGPDRGLEHAKPIRVDLPVRSTSHREPDHPLADTDALVSTIVVACDDKFGSDSRDGSESAQAFPLPLQPTTNFDRYFDGNSVATNTSEQDVRISITVPAARRCEMTPPQSSGLQSEDEDDNAGSFGGSATSYQWRHETTAEPQDLKPIADPDQEHLLDQFCQDSTKIDLGNNCFRTIEKNRAVKVLQKLVDSQLDELKYCQRGAHQASSAAQRQVFELRAKHLSRLLQSMREDEGIWLGGAENDRAVAML